MSRPAQNKSFGLYVRHIANQLGLRDWTITLMHDFADDDCMAQVHCIHARKVANIRFATDFHTYTPEQVRHTVVHELTHCHTTHMDKLIEAQSGPLGLQAYEQLCNAWNLAHEYAVDGIADALSMLLPLPNKSAMRLTP